ncbi:MAG: DUF342 domain-containing protein [Planctomycetes bacterium]|nr:DUF342 domain-containing protein [Planctomycetota bacterium]
MGRIHVSIAPDGMTATARIAPGPVALPAALGEALAAAGVVHGVDEAACRSLAARLADPSTDASAQIAVGAAPQHGRDGCLEGTLLEGQRVGRPDHLGNIDYHERDLLHPIAADAKIARVVPPTDGVDGRDVRGRRLPARPGKAHRQRLGAGVRLTEGALFAAVDGVVLATDRLLDVVQLYSHNGDVDYRSGNLHSKGSLLIQGDVTEGFSATADGDVVVGGVVQGGGVRAGGSAHVGKGVLGHDDAVRAGADITCHHATAARLVAGRDIAVADQVADSQLQAQSMRIVDGRGSVRGSELRARDRIEVGTAGSPAGTTTTLIVGDLLQERAELARRTLAAARAERAERGRKGVRAAVRAGDAELQLQLTLRARQREILRAAEILILGVCHQGVVLRFGDAELRPTEDLRAVRFRFDLRLDSIVRERL